MKWFLIACCAFLLGCSKQQEYNSDCLLYAANAKVVFDAKNKLDPHYRSELLMLWRRNMVGHVYLVFVINHTIFAYDRSGSRIVLAPVRCMSNPVIMAILIEGDDVLFADYVK